MTVSFLHDIRNYQIDFKPHSASNLINPFQIAATAATNAAFGGMDLEETFTYGQDEEAFMKQVDSAGAGHWSVNPNTGGFVEFNLHHDNAANLALNALLNKNILPPIGINVPFLGTFSVGSAMGTRNLNLIDLTISHNVIDVANGGAAAVATLLKGNHGRIVKQPDGSRGKDVKLIKWRFEFVQLEIYETGTPTLGSVSS